MCVRKHVCVCVCSSSQTGELGTIWDQRKGQVTWITTFGTEDYDEVSKEYLLQKLNFVRTKLYNFSQSYVAEFIYSSFTNFN